MVVSQVASIANGYARTLRHYADTIIAARSGKIAASEAHLAHLAVNGAALAGAIVLAHPRYRSEKPWP